MMDNKSKTLFVLTFLPLILLAVDFDNNLGYLFMGIALGNIVLMIIDTKFPLPIEKTRNLGRTFAYVFGGLVAYFLLNYLVLNTFKSYLGLSVVDLKSVFQLVAQQNLLFHGSVWLTILAIGFIVAIQETWLLANFMDFLRDKTGANLKNFFSHKTLFILGTVVLFFTFLHFEAKGLSLIALIPVIIFFLVSAVVIILEGQSLAAMIMHVINNVMAIIITSYAILTMGIFGPIAVGVGIAFIIYLVLSKVNILRTLT